MTNINSILMSLTILITLQNCSSSPTYPEQLALLEAKATFIKKLNNSSEEEQIKVIQRNRRNFSYIKNPSEAVQLAMVKDEYLTYFNIKNPSEKVELQAMKGAIERFISTGGNNDSGYGMGRSENMISILEKTKYEKVQLLAININPQFIDFIKYPHISIKNNYQYLAYKEKQRITKLKRKMETEKRMKEYSSSDHSSSSSSSSNSNSYSAPQRTCRNVTRTKTVYVPGGNGRTTLQNYTERVCN